MYWIGIGVHRVCDMFYRIIEGFGAENSLCYVAIVYMIFIVDQQFEKRANMQIGFLITEGFYCDLYENIQIVINKNLQISLKISSDFYEFFKHFKWNIYNNNK